MIHSDVCHQRSRHSRDTLPSPEYLFFKIQGSLESITKLPVSFNKSFGIMAAPDSNSQQRMRKRTISGATESMCSHQRWRPILGWSVGRWTCIVLFCSSLQVKDKLLMKCVYSIPVSKLPQLVYETKEDLARSGLNFNLPSSDTSESLPHKVIIHQCRTDTRHSHGLILFRDDRELQSVSEAVHGLIHCAIAMDGTCMSSLPNAFLAFVYRLSRTNQVLANMASGPTPISCTQRARASVRDREGVWSEMDGAVVVGSGLISIRSKAFVDPRDLAQLHLHSRVEVDAGHSTKH